MTVPSAGGTGAPPRLLHFRVSHYNEKVRWALDHKRWPHRRQALVPGFHLPAVWRLTGQRKLPVLVLDGRVLLDSTAIIAEIERRCPEPPLYPADPVLRARALALEDHFDEVVAPDLRRLFWSAYLPRPADAARMATDGAGAAARVVWRLLFPLWRPAFRSAMGVGAADVAAARARLVGHMERLEAEIGPVGYLAGDAFSVADLTAAAVMTAIIRPPQFSYALPEPWPAALVELRESIAHRAGFRWVMEIYERHRGTSAELPPRAPTSTR